MDASALIGRVDRIVDDSRYDSDTILSFLNRGVQDIAAGGSRPYGLPKVAPLPDLFSVGTVTTGAGNSVSLPAIFGRSLKMVVRADGYNIPVMDSHINFIKRNPGQDNSGSVEACCAVGSNLYYNPIPSSPAELAVYFFRLPVDMTALGDTPDGIPVHLHDRLLVSYACMEIFNEVEDGIEGAKVNTRKYEQLYHAALTDLDRFIGPEDQEPQYIEDTTDYI